jgi:hypothetical protein
LFEFRSILISHSSINANTTLTRVIVTIRNKFVL